MLGRGPGNVGASGAAPRSSKEEEGRVHLNHFGGLSGLHRHIYGQYTVVSTPLYVAHGMHWCLAKRCGISRGERRPLPDLILAR